MAPRKTKTTASKKVAPVAKTVIPTVGDHPFVEADELTIKKWKGIFGRQLDAVNPMWNDDIELATMKALGFTSSPVNTQVSINERFSKAYPVSELNIPRDPIAVIQSAEKYRNDNPFVSKAVRVKTDFTVKNFRHLTHNTRSKTFYDKKAKELNLWTVSREICYNLYSIGVAPIWWGGEEGPIETIFVLDPKQCYWQNIMGKTKLWLRIDARMLAAVKDPTGRDKPENKALYESLPKYWIAQIAEHLKNLRPQGLIELKEGSYTVVQNRYNTSPSIMNTIDSLPLQPAFDALQRYRLLAAGDFAMAWNVKNMITLISEGDPDKDKENYRPADTQRLLNLQKAFSSPDYSLRIFCDATTRVEYVIPPLDAFKTIKYEQVEKEIKTCLNLPSFMWGNFGTTAGTFGNATAELMLLREEVDAMRKLMEVQFYEPLYEILYETCATGFKAADIVLPSFDKNSLRDDAIWLTALPMLYGQGAISLRSLMETFGLDYDYEIDELKIEHKSLGTNIKDRPNQTVAQPHFEPGQGGTSPLDDKGGRPQKNAKQDNDPVRSPRSAGK